jgi:hypothetical protein
VFCNDVDVVVAIFMTPVVVLLTLLCVVVVFVVLLVEVADPQLFVMNQLLLSSAYASMLRTAKKILAKERYFTILFI